MDRTRPKGLRVRLPLLRPSFGRFVDRLEQTSRVLEPRPANSQRDDSALPLIERRRPVWGSDPEER